MTTSCQPDEIVEWSWIILTTGNRPTELERAVASIRRQTPPAHWGPRSEHEEIIVVLNGAPDAWVPPGCTSVVSATNLGIPGGRNRGAEFARGECLFFLDDDASLVGDDFLVGLDRRFNGDHVNGDHSVDIVSCAIVDPDTGETQRRHVPRLRVGDPSESSEVTTFLGGASGHRAEMFRACGGLPANFFYAHEETDLAWAVLDRGGRIFYAGDLVVHHPASVPSRHGGGLHRSARNRVWLARRRLPQPLSSLYVVNWFVLSVLRCRDRVALQALVSGTLEGLRNDPGERRRISRRTIWRMCRLGRPPLL